MPKASKPRAAKSKPAATNARVAPKQLSKELFAAAGSGDAARLSELIARAQDGGLEPSLDEAVHGAVERGQVEALEIVLRHGASPNALRHGCAALARVVHQSNGAELARVLLGAGADPNGPSILGRTAAHAAAEHGTTELLALLVEAGADVDRAADEGRAPLHFAVEHGTLESVALLLDAGVDVAQRRTDGRSALHLAIERGLHPLVELLLARGADPCARGAEGATALHVAYQWGMDSLVPLLLVAGADRSVEDDRGISFASIFGPRGEDVRPITARYAASGTPQRVTITARFAMLAPAYARGLKRLHSAHAWATLAEHGLASGALFAPGTSRIEVLDTKPLAEDEIGVVERTYVLSVTSVAPEFFHAIVRGLLANTMAPYSTTRRVSAVRGVFVDIRGEGAGVHALDGDTLRRWIIDDAYAPASFRPLPFALEVRTGKATRVQLETASGEPCDRALAALDAWLAMEPTWKVRTGETRVLFMPTIRHSRFDGKAFVPEPNGLEISAFAGKSSASRKFPYELDRPQAHLENVLAAVHAHTPLTRVVLEIAP